MQAFPLPRPSLRPTQHSRMHMRGTESAEESRDEGLSHSLLTGALPRPPLSEKEDVDWLGHLESGTGGQRHGWLGYDEDDEIPKLSESTKRTFSQPSHPAVRAAEFVCFVVSLAITVYFVSINHLNVALQYTQVCFISSITIVLDSLDPVTQHIWFVICAIVAVGWFSITIWSGNVYMDYHLRENIVDSFTGLSFFGGLLICIYASISAPRAVKRVEIDLLLYLISLNAICFFSSDVFNNNLHMILDLRTYVLLFNCLLQPKDKMDLLKSKSLVLIVILSIVAFVVYAPLTVESDFYGNLLYIVIGLLLTRRGVKSILKQHSS